MKRYATHYDRLMVARNASQEVIRAAYRALSHKYHPDHNRDDAEATRLMQVINESYELLSDPARRQTYDMWLAQQEMPWTERAAWIARSGVSRAADLSRTHLTITRLICAAALSVTTVAVAYWCLRPSPVHKVPAGQAAKGTAAILSVSPERHELQVGTIARPEFILHQSSHDALPGVTQDQVSAHADVTTQHRRTAATRASSHARVHKRPVHRLAHRRPVHHRTHATRPAVPASSPSGRASGPDDLAEVRKKDPAAAQLIASYCSEAATQAKDPVAGAAACRSSEVEAWRDFVLHSNFSRLYQTLSPICARAPFPDSYEAKDACVKYALAIRSHTRQ